MIAARSAIEQSAEECRHLARDRPRRPDGRQAVRRAPGDARTRSPIPSSWTRPRPAASNRRRSRAARSSGSSADKKRFVTYSPGDIWMVGDLVKYGVKVEAKPEEEQSFLAQIFISWFPMLLLIGVWIFFMRQMQGGGRGGAFSFGKSKAQDPRRVQQHGHLRRRRRLRRGQGGSERDRRVPARSRPSSRSSAAAFRAAC